MGDKIPVVIVTRNGIALTKKTLASVLKQDVPVEPLIIENFSNDGTAQYLATKNVAVIHAPEQWSLAKCWNVALQALWKAGHSQAILANNDIAMRSDCSRLLSAHGGPFVSCVSVNDEAQLGEPGDRDIETLRSGQRERPDFSCFLIRKSVTDTVGWFDEDCWPAFTEDSRFHVRCHRKGVRCVCIDLPFLHFGSATIKQCDEGERARIQRGAQKNRETFKRLYGCFPGQTVPYDALFSDETFGIDNRRVA